MEMPERGLIDTVSALWGGAMTTLLAAFVGRLMYHSSEVRAHRRRFFGWELLWEIPVAVGMAVIGEARSRYLGIESPVSTGLVATLAYLGPRGAEALIERLIRGKSAS